MFETVTIALDWLGVIAFAITGSLVASRKQMDLVGFTLLGVVTGIGGGTLRDVLLGAPMFWVREPAYLIACVLVSGLVFFTAHFPQSRYRFLPRQPIRCALKRLEAYGKIGPSASSASHPA